MAMLHIVSQKVYNFILRILIICFRNEVFLKTFILRNIEFIKFLHRFYQCPPCADGIAKQRIDLNHIYSFSSLSEYTIVKL